MKTPMFSLLFSLVLTSPAFAQSAYIISGFDDVLRQAENTGLVKAAIKIFEKDHGFTGMSVLYSEISKNERDPHFSLVSGIATWFENRVDSLLTREQFPSRRLYLRNWVTQMNLEKFKIDNVATIIDDHPGRKFIVIFDNSDASLTLADQLMNKFPAQILEVYLHQIIDKKIPSRAKAYHTAFDIAVNEYKNGRLDAGSVKNVADSILKENRLEALIPAYAVCPPNKTSTDFELPQEIEMLRGQVESHLATLCTLRKQ
ncbi:phosphatase domain-containing protein [Bdellovibrio sp. NC01]|uniref:phosphatase domain-containing protein n=1 Tax=Bdellovibrio sp. NC01 TaxID=2220073 RepID=UPI001156DB01|nr:phosphatase domain-containing protein [Bdellovibrio sp. NC01]QDK37581.1 hypothetical protein DOE51_08275 [Bdellovibrio sp. NC01]